MYFLNVSSLYWYRRRTNLDNFMATIATTQAARSASRVTTQPITTRWQPRRRFRALVTFVMSRLVEPPTDAEIMHLSK